MNAESILTARATFVTLIVIAGVLFLTTNLPWQLDDYDQAQQAFTSYEMVHEGHWFYQRTPHELIAQKPPLVGWLSAGLFAITRSWDVAWRLPSLLAAVGLAVSIYYAAGRAYGTLPALIALAAFSLNLLTVRLATLVRTDMPLALIAFLAGWMVFEKVRKAQEWQTRDRVVFTALLAASMWIKGPFLVVFLLPPLLIAYLLSRKRSLIGVWPGWWPWVVSLALFAPWIIGGLRLFPTFYQQIIGFEVIDRLAPNPHRAFGPYVPGAHRAFGPYFYFLHLLHKLAPWSILMLALLVIAIRRNKRFVPRGLAPATLWLLLWTFTGLVIMSLVPSKRVDRVYSVIPPLCLLLAAQVAAALSDPARRNTYARWLVTALAFAVLFTGGYTVWKIGSGYRDHLDALERFGHEVRAQTKAHEWRYEVISGLAGSEGMLLYLERPHFIETEEAVRRWNNGDIDAIAVPTNERDELVPQLWPPPVSLLHSVHRRSQPRVDYELLARDD